MSDSKQQHDPHNATPSKQPQSQSQQSQPGKGGSHLTPLKVTDKTLECDDTLFTEGFVRKFTPRSMEACRLLGVLPEELVLRSYENFYEFSVTPNIQKLRYQDYEQMRQETIAMVREERQTLIQQGWNDTITPTQKLKIQSATLKAMMLPTNDVVGASPQRVRSNTSSPIRGASAGATRSGHTVNVGSGKQLNKSATTGDLSKRVHEDSHHGGQRSILLPHLMPEELLLEMEQDRLRKTMARQNKEIESMMAYELKVAQMLAKQEQKLEVRRQKEQQQAEQRREERFRQAEKRRLWELQKLDEEEKMKAANIQSMARLNAQEQKHLEEMNAKDMERKKEADRKAAERRKKKMELELRAQQNLEKQFELARERERDMAERDQRRKEALEEKRARLAKEHAQQKAEAARRVQTVLQTNAQALEEKRDDLNRKMDEMEQRLRSFEDLKQQIANEKAEEIKAKEERRLAALHDSRSQLDGRIHGILEKKAKHDSLKEELEMKAREQHILKMELRRLNKIRKQANVERLKRMQEYHRTSLNEKLSDEAKRLKELEEQKKELMAKRQQNAINMFRQKQSLVKMFSEMSTKRNWEALSKLQMKDGKICSGEDDEEDGTNSPLKLGAAVQNRSRYGGGDDHGDDSGNGVGNGGSDSNGPVNLLDALQGLNKLVNKQKRRENDRILGTQKKSNNIDDYMKNQNRQNMARSRSQGMI